MKMLFKDKVIDAITSLREKIGPVVSAGLANDWRLLSASFSIYQKNFLIENRIEGKKLDDFNEKITIAFLEKMEEQYRHNYPNLPFDKIVSLLKAKILDNT